MKKFDMNYSSTATNFDMSPTQLCEMFKPAP